MDVTACCIWICRADGEMPDFEIRVPFSPEFFKHAYSQRRPFLLNLSRSVCPVAESCNSDRTRQLKRRCCRGCLLRKHTSWGAENSFLWQIVSVDLLDEARV